MNKRNEPTSFEESEKAEGLRGVVDRLDAQIAAQRAIGAPSKALLAEREAAVRDYQAARIAADRPRVA